MWRVEWSFRNLILVPRIRNPLLPWVACPSNLTTTLRIYLLYLGVGAALCIHFPHPNFCFPCFTSGWDSPHPEVECVWEWVESAECHLLTFCPFCGYSTRGCRGLLSPVYFRSAERVCVVAPYALRLRYLEHCNYASYLPRGGRSFLHASSVPELMFSFFLPRGGLKPTTR